MFQRRYIYRTLLGLAAAVFLASCNFPTSTQQPGPAAQFTEAAQTVAAELTAAGPVSTHLPPSVATERPELTPTVMIDKTPTTPALPSATLAPTATEAFNLLFSDDFSSETGWFTQKTDDYGFGFADGGYVIYANIPNADIWSIRDQNYADVILEVEAAQRSGATDGYYGLVCRQVDGENYYGLVINSNGFYGIGKMEAGEWAFLQDGAGEYFRQDSGGVIKLGLNVPNKIRADCLGDSLRLSVNGQKLLEVQDDDHPEGSAMNNGVTGLMIGTQQQPELEVIFDNFAVYQPLR